MRWISAKRDPASGGGKWSGVLAATAARIRIASRLSTPSPDRPRNRRMEMRDESACRAISPVTHLRADGACDPIVLSPPEMLSRSGCALGASEPSRDAGYATCRVGSGGGLAVPEGCVDISRTRVRGNWHSGAAVAKHFASRWPRGLASEPRPRVHREKSRIESDDSRNRRLRGFEHVSFLTSVQAQQGMRSHDLRRHETSGARQVHDDIHAGQTSRHSAGMRIRRSVALLQTVSPRCRHEPPALASRLD
jgi:hypothetical protein